MMITTVSELLENNSSYLVDYKKPCVQVATDLIVATEFDERLGLQAGKPYIRVDLTLVSVRGKTANSSVDWFTSLEDANKFIGKFDDYLIK